MADKAAPIAHPDSSPAGFGRGIPTQPRRSGQQDLRRITITTSSTPQSLIAQETETQRPVVSIPGGSPEGGPDGIQRSKNWFSEKHSMILSSDLAVIVAAVLFVSFLSIDADFSVRSSWKIGASTWLLGGITVMSWLTLLAAEGVWDANSLTNRTRDARSTLVASLVVLAGVGIYGYLAESDLARPYLLIAVPVGTAGLLITHSLWRRRFELFLSSNQERCSIETCDSTKIIGVDPVPGSGIAAADVPLVAGDAESPVRPSRGRIEVKTVLDLVVAALGILLLSPLLLLAAIVIPLTDGGPVFHQQEYVGRAGKVFTGWTFRCTPYGPMARPAAVGVMNGSARRTEYGLATTSIGRLLRRTGLASAPMLFNVLARQMSIVGPKPLSPWNFAPHPDAIRPGITGHWRIGAWRHDDPGKGLDNVANFSITGDAGIVLRTLKLAITGRLSG